MTFTASDFWTPIIVRACEHYETPFYLFSQTPISEKIDCITRTCGPLVSNWLSFKTLPLPNLLRWWLNIGSGVEVVSQFELLAAYKEGFPPSRIIVNGVAKHSWSESCWKDELRVNFDSFTEIQRLSSIGKNRRWRVGVRFHPSNQRDPENSLFPDQFGIPADGFAHACDLLKQEKIRLDTIHIHLRSNVPSLDYYREALDELRRSMIIADVRPRCFDWGGGLPVDTISQLDDAWHSTLSLEDLSAFLLSCQKAFPKVREYVLENGRFVLSGCGVLVLTVKDVKEIGGVRYLICDGGRTNQALPSDWEAHEVSILPARTGKLVSTAICGPTCMAFDCISRNRFPNDVGMGDKVVWFDAGAYHLSWENRFSQPLARVLWHDEHDDIIESRRAESFSRWWGRWG